jgi:hypothetical protein
MKALLRPSAPVALGVLALVVAGTGTAYSAATINGATIKPNTVTGKQVEESSLATVPRSAEAKTVGGSTIMTFNFSVAVNNPAPSSPRTGI